MTALIETLLAALPAIAAVAVVVASVQLLQRGSPAPLPAGGGRYASLDGLRAFLAMGVVCSHLASYRERFFVDGTWSWPENWLLRYAGEASVMLFFMITGFLFWSKAIASGGRLNAWDLYRNRFLRIMPLYGVFCLVVLAFAAARSGFTLRVSRSQLLLDLGKLALPGAFPKDPINGVDPTMLTLQVWTLAYEWLFYLSLPLLSVFSRGIAGFSLLLVLLVVYVFARRFVGWIPPTTFAMGMATAHLRTLVDPKPWMRAKGTALIVLLGILVPVLLGKSAQGKLGLAVFGLLFLAAVYGNTFLGILTLKGSRRLGEISYSIYLIHPPILYAALLGLNATHPVTALSSGAFWLCSLGILCIVCLCASATYEAFEKPYLHGARRPLPGSVRT